MAYAVPTQFEHSDYPTAADMTKFKDGTDATHDIIGDVKVQGSVLINQRSYYFTHRHRWLIYRGDGEMEDPTGVGTDVTLTGDGTNYVTYDLSQVDWLYPGKLYSVEAVVACFEDYEAY